MQEVCLSWLSVMMLCAKGIPCMKRAHQLRPALILIYCTNAMLAVVVLALVDDGMTTFSGIYRLYLLRLEHPIA